MVYCHHEPKIPSVWRTAKLFILSFSIPTITVLAYGLTSWTHKPNCVYSILRDPFALPDLERIRSFKNTGMLVATLFGWFLSISGVAALTLDVTTPITVHADQPEVILPCEYRLDNPSGKFTVKWTLGHAIILKIDSNGESHPGEGYDGKVQSGDGCSLVLRNPQSEDAGRYKVRILVLDEEQDGVEESAQVLLRKTAHGPQLRTTTVTAPPNPPRSDLGWDSVLSVLSSLGLMYLAYSSLKSVRRLRRSETVKERNRRFVLYLLSRGAFVFLFASMILSVVKMTQGWSQNITVTASVVTIVLAGALLSIHLYIYNNNPQPNGTEDTDDAQRE